MMTVEMTWQIYAGCYIKRFAKIVHDELISIIMKNLVVCMVLKINI